MKARAALIIFLLTLSLHVSGQKVYQVKYKSQADLKVYVVEYESQADLKVYFVEYESLADLKIFIVKYESQAGWKNLEKQHLLL